jgi:hypothetical protein
MTCQRAQDWLLQAEEPRPERCPSPELAEHIHTCPVCGALTAELLQLERAWREVPLPASAETAQKAFLERLESPPVHRLSLPRTRPLLRSRWALAASILFIVGLGGWFLLTTSQAQASAEVVDSLIDWNLDLAEAGSPADRERIYADRAAALRTRLQKANLPQEEKELAEKLLENGSWLAENDDPMGAADRFNDVADQLLERMNAANRHGNHKELRRQAHRYQRVTDMGIKEIKKAMKGPRKGRHK